uniref:Uncharacterized protein n=1 Tax=Meloidogyne enterolobii TaxID=390850 RepID=A0A6V7W8Q4_MELEN|nr:unnamed protein product [Meloidogyne enterolobii]
MLANRAFNTIQEIGSLVRDLRSDELELTDGAYPVSCQCNLDYENVGNIEAFRKYAPLIDTYKITESSRQITSEEFEAFEPYRIQGRRPNTYDLYKLLYSDLVFGSDYDDLQRRLEQYYINDCLIEQITHQVTNNELGYDPRVTQLEQFGDLRIPRKIRELYIPYNPTDTTVGGQTGEAGGSGEGGSSGEAGGSSQHASGRRRSREDAGGNGGMVEPTAVLGEAVAIEGEEEMEAIIERGYDINEDEILRELKREDYFYKVIGMERNCL